jgi:hypothetical protein
MYDFVFLIDFGNTSKTYYSCLSLNCSPMINFKIGSLHKTIAHVHVYYMVYCLWYYWYFFSLATYLNPSKHNKGHEEKEKTLVMYGDHKWNWQGTSNLLIY